MANATDKDSQEIAELEAKLKAARARKKQHEIEAKAAEADELRDEVDRLNQELDKADEKYADACKYMQGLKFGGNNGTVYDAWMQYFEELHNGCQ